MATAGMVPFACCAAPVASHLSCHLAIERWKGDRHQQTKRKQPTGCATRYRGEEAGKARQMESEEHGGDRNLSALFDCPDVPLIPMGLYSRVIVAIHPARQSDSRGLVPQAPV